MPIFFPPQYNQILMDEITSWPTWFPTVNSVSLEVKCVYLFFSLDLCFLSVAQEKDTSLYRPALEELRRQIRSSTTSMTSVPKPLKFLRPHYAKLKEIYQNMATGENKVCLLHQLCVSCFIWWFY